MGMTDCSQQLQSAPFTTFVICRETVTRLLYRNMVLVHLLYFDSVARKRLRGIEVVGKHDCEIAGGIWDRCLSERVQVTCSPSTQDLGEQQAYGAGDRQRKESL
jgi:hypothetical protein